MNHLTQHIRWATSFAILLGSATAQGAAFQPGSLVVYRVGDGSVAMNTDPAPVFLDEYSARGVLLQSIPMPTSASGANNALIAQGSAGLEGVLKRSTDGRYLTLTGYNHPLGTPLVDTGGNNTLAQSFGTIINRTIGRVSAAGAVDTTTTISDSGQGSPRSVISDNGTNLWVSHGSISGGTDGGVRYTTLGAAGVSTLINTGTTDPRAINIFNNQLHVSSASITTGTLANSAVAIAGTGLPTSNDAAYVGFPGVEGGTTKNIIDFFMVDLSPEVAGMDTLYVAGDGTAAISKYSLVDGSWYRNGTLGANADDYRGITGVVSGTTVTLYATKTGGGNALMSLVDTTGFHPANGVFETMSITQLATGGTNQLFKGIALAPVSAAVPGDFNSDGLVNAADLTKWKQSFGGPGADGNNDGVTDGNDFLIWQRNYAGAPAAPVAAAVPEPATATLLVVASLIGSRLAGKRRREEL